MIKKIMCFDKQHYGFGLLKNYKFKDYINNPIYNKCTNNVVGENVVPEFVDDVSVTFTVTLKQKHIPTFFYIEYDNDSFYSDKTVFYWVDDYVVNNHLMNNITFKCSLEIFSLDIDFGLSITRTNANNYQVIDNNWNIVSPADISSREGFSLVKNEQWSNFRIKYKNSPTTNSYYRNWIFYNNWDKNDSEKISMLSSSNYSVVSKTNDPSHILYKMQSFDYDKTYHYASDSVSFIKYLPSIFRAQTVLIGGTKMESNKFFSEEVYKNKIAYNGYEVSFQNVNYDSVVSSKQFLKIRSPFVAQVKKGTIVKYFAISNYNDYFVAITTNSTLNTLFFLTQNQTIERLDASVLIDYLKVLFDSPINKNDDNYIYNYQNDICSFIVKNAKECNYYDEKILYDTYPESVKMVLEAINLGGLGTCYAFKDIDVLRLVQANMYNFEPVFEDNFDDPKTVFSTEINDYFFWGFSIGSKIVDSCVNEDGTLNIKLHYQLTNTNIDNIQLTLLSRRNMLTESASINSTTSLKSSAWSNFMLSNANSWQAGLSYAQESARLTKQSSTIGMVGNLIGGGLSILSGIFSLSDGNVLSGLSSMNSGLFGGIKSMYSSWQKRLTADYSIGKINAEQKDLQNVVDFQQGSYQSELYSNANSLPLKVMSVHNREYLNKHFLLFGWKCAQPLITTFKLYKSVNNHFDYLEGDVLYPVSQITPKCWGVVDEEVKKGIFVVKNWDNVDYIFTGLENKNNYLRSNKIVSKTE